MVFPNFFITFVRHSFHTSHPYTSPSRERRHRPAPPYHQAPHSPHGTRAASRIKRTRLPHALHLARAMPHTPSALPPLAKSYAHAPHTRYAPTPSQHTRPPCYHPLARAMPRTRSRAKMPQCFPLPPLLSKKKERASTTKILHITILHVTFTRIGVKTTQKSEAIFSFID